MSYLQQKQLNTTSLGSGQTWTLKDYRGFTVFQVDESGNVKRKGTDVKL